MSRRCSAPGLETTAGDPTDEDSRDPLAGVGPRSLLEDLLDTNRHGEGRPMVEAVRQAWRDAECQQHLRKRVEPAADEYPFLLRRRPSLDSRALELCCCVGYRVYRRDGQTFRDRQIRDRLVARRYRQVDRECLQRVARIDGDTAACRRLTVCVHGGDDDGQTWVETAMCDCGVHSCCEGAPIIPY